MMPLILISLAVFAAPEPQMMSWTVAGHERQAIVHLPQKIEPQGSPVVFGFHGHGGNARNASRVFALQTHWPEAIVVYMQGVPTPGRLTDPAGRRNGWQHAAGEQDDRDLKFFDAVLATLKQKHRVDETRIYATGHSNGGRFTYLLWSQRPDVFAAMAPSAAAARYITDLKPLPAMHIAGTNDLLVKYAWQQAAMASVRKVNQCSDDGQPWAADCIQYPSPRGTPFVAFIHEGDHKYPATAPSLIVKFFKEHRKPHPASAGR